MADPSLFQAYMNSRGLKTPAFNFVPGIGFQPTEQTSQIVNAFKEKTGKQYSVEPANSVMAIEGSPMWGSGGGVVFNDNLSTGFVDPLQGTAHVVAHESAHSLFPSNLMEITRGKVKTDGTNTFLTGNQNINPLNVPRDTGQRLRYVHEIFAKPKLEEEARAQGVAYGLLNKLGIPSEETWQSPLDYPKTYLKEGLGKYVNTEIGPPSTAERKEADAIIRGVDPYLQRVFNQGYRVFN